jgi:hypothetical protein
VANVYRPHFIDGVTEANSSIGFSLSSGQHVGK